MRYTDNELTGRAAQERPELNYLVALPKVISRNRGANRESRRQKDRDVRSELKQVNQALSHEKLDAETREALELRQSQLELYEASSHTSVNTPYRKDA